ncbi:MAG: hypothetical protein HFE76_16370 [Firmicutes bacterium]|nr:hypothetical protein [Bacillota bacterium]
MAFMLLLPSSGQAVYAAAKAGAPKTFYGKAVNSTSITLKWSSVKNVKKYAVYQGKSK